MTIAVIPARGGSKRIPRKNIRNFCEIPIIAYSIATARQSQIFDHVIVSTDDQEIADVAAAYGAEVPFIRPAELANDFAGTIEVMAHAIKWMLNQKWAVHSVCCIYPTAPFVGKEDIERGFKALNSDDKWAYAISATDYAAPIFRSFKALSKGGLEMFFPEHFETRSQDLPRAFHDAAQFYWGTSAAWLNGERIFGRHSMPIVIPRWRVHDIDTEDDWVRAEIIYGALNDQTLFPRPVAGRMV